MNGMAARVSEFAAQLAEELLEAENTQTVHEIIAEVSKRVADQAQQEDWTPSDHQVFWNELRMYLSRLQQPHGTG